MKSLAPDQVDGIFGAVTDGAVRSFQSGQGLTADGIVGPLTWSALPVYVEASPTLSRGATGPVVARLQKALQNLGYSGAVDGIFGVQTEAAVKAFQGSDESSTGIVDELTWLSPVGAAGLTLEGAAGLTTF